MLAVGAIMLVLILALPLWHAVQLLTDSNFVFWIGRSMPLMVIFASLFVLLLWVSTVIFFFKLSHVEFRTKQTVLMIGSIFVALLGLALVVFSLIFTLRVEEMHMNMWSHCGMTADTIYLASHYEALMKVRQESACLAKLSVKECPGFVDAMPYTGFLEDAEKEFQCSGFCLPGTDTTLLQPAQPAAAVAAAYLPVVTPAPALPVAPAVAPPDQGANDNDFVTDDQEIQEIQNQSANAGQTGVLLLRTRHPDKVTPITLVETGLAPYAPDVPSNVPPTVAYPPTLFSKANFRVSCQGMMARDLKFNAQDIGRRLFVQGVALLLISVVACFLMLIGLCGSTKPQEHQGLPGNPQGIDVNSYGSHQLGQLGPMSWQP